MDILDIISQSLLHPLDTTAQAQLDHWLAESEEHQQLYQSLLASDDLAEQYHRCMNLNEGEAWAKLKPLLEKHALKPEITSKDGQADKHQLHLIYNIRQRFTSVANQVFTKKYLVRSAAAVIGIILVIGGLHLYQGKPTQTMPAPISQEMVAAMQKAEASDINEATLQVGSEKPQQVRSLTSFLQTIAQQDVDEDVKGTLTTRHDKEFWMTLPDGTRVHLNGNSRLSYPLAFKGDLREVALVGEAYFIVAKDKDHPFIVHTADGDIKEYGTEFNVSTHGTNTEVVLVRGSISVKPKLGTEKMMVPGDKAEMASAKLAMSRVDVEPYIAWNTGHFSFDDCTLEFAKKRHASVMVRGLRAVTDFENEIQLAQTNHALMPGIETMFLATSIKWSYLSSTIVKEAAYYGSDISKFVTPNVEKAVNEKYALIRQGKNPEK